MTKFDEIVEMVSRQYENEVMAPPVPKEGWAELIREYINETIEQRNGNIARRLKEQWMEFFGDESTYTPITLDGFEKAVSDIEKERAADDPLAITIDYEATTDGKFDGKEVDWRHADEHSSFVKTDYIDRWKQYIMGCDPYKEGGEGSFTIFQEPSVLTQEQFDEEIQRLAKFFNPKINSNDQI